MKRFSLLGLLIAVGVCACAIALTTIVYERWIVPNTPIDWIECAPLDLGKLENKDRHIVIVAGNWSGTGSFADVRTRLETPALRVIVARFSIRCWVCDVTAAKNLANFFDQEKVIGTLPRNIPTILVKSEGKWVICPLGDDPQLASTKRCIENAFK